MASIVFHAVTKSFMRNSRQTLLRSLFLGQIRDSNKQERFIALNNVSFDLRDGESVAIVGRNGAGKSTLLNLIAGLSEPDSGTIEVKGRVAALLDLGAGFHPDLTGRENLFVNAALNGLRRKEAEQRYDSIVEFSGLGDFIDQPLRTYSSGMYVRLGFAVAVNVDPDIFIIDEVLAVGDGNFQEKCFAKIRQLKESGTLFVCASHAPLVLRQICKKALWLEQGELVMGGAIDEVLGAYRHDAHELQIRPA